MCFDLRSCWLVLWGQFQRCPQFFHWFIDRKARTSRRQLNDVTIWVIGVNTLEVGSVHDRGNAVTSFYQPLTPDQLGLLIGDSQRKVMCLPCPHTCPRSSR